MHDISFIGNVTVDIIMAGTNEKIVPGGGSVNASFAAKSIIDRVQLIAKCPKDKLPLFDIVEKYGIDATFIDSHSVTTLKIIYPSPDPDVRIIQVISRGDSYTEEDLSIIDSKVVHIAPSMYGEFDETFIPQIREKADLLSLDAQGFVRKVSPDGELRYHDWEKKEEFLPLIDILKVDLKEASVLTNTNDPLEALSKIATYGVKEILLTRREGLIVYITKDKEKYEWPFENSSLEGRTGRGDTCIGAYLAARINNPPNKAGEIAAKITNEKMRTPGPWLGRNR
jgi:sugar/nucleoside kinase (ribokinase family)